MTRENSSNITALPHCLLGFLLLREEDTYLPRGAQWKIPHEAAVEAAVGHRHLTETLLHALCPTQREQKTR